MHQHHTGLGWRLKARLENVRYYIIVGVNPSGTYSQR
jgi:hypothetical protein